MSNTNPYRLKFPTENSPRPVNSQADDLKKCKDDSEKTLNEIRELQEKRDNSSFELLDIFGGVSRKKRLTNEIKDLEIQLQNNSSLPNSEKFDIETLYGTLIEYFDVLKKEANTPEEKTYFEEKSAMSSLYLEEYRYLEELIDTNTKRIDMYLEKAYITNEAHSNLQNKIEEIYKPLQQNILQYVKTFKENACGSQEQQNKTITPAKKVLDSYSETSTKIHSFENKLTNYLLDVSKQHPFSKNIKKEALALIHNIHANRLDNATQQIMILSDLRNIETFHGESDISVNAISVPNTHIAAQKEAIKLALQNNANEILREFSIYEDLKNPSILSSQGRKQLKSDALSVIEDVAIPQFAKLAIQSIEGKEAQKSVTQYFQEFVKNSAYKNYMQNLQRLGNPEDEIYTLMNNPTSENKKKVQNFIKELQDSEKAYLKEFYTLTEKLLEKGVSHEQIDKIWKFVANHPLEIVGIGAAASIGTWSLVKKILKITGKNISKRLLSILSLIVVDEKMLNNTMKRGNNWQ